MRSIKTFLLALMALLLSVPAADAQKMVGRILSPDEIQDGIEVVFEARSGTTSKGRYLWPYERYDGGRSCQQISSILEVPDEIVWTLVKAGVQNAQTGLDQYYIKNKKNGKYLTFNWNTDNNTVYKDGNAVNFVSDTADAKAFCIVSNDDATWKGQYGSNSYGSSQSDWTGTTFTVVNIFPAGSNNANNGDGYGRMFLCNEFEVSGFNITWYSQYQDTNVWDIRRVTDRATDPKEALEDLLDNFQATADVDYEYGTDPGYIANEEVYNKYFDSYNDALQMLDKSGVTDEQFKAMFTTVYDAKQAIDDESNTVQIEDGGYYYVKTAYSAFTSASNGEFAWMAPYNSTNVGWKAFKEGDNQFIWQFKEDPDETLNSKGERADTRMYYTMQNVGSKLFIGNAASHSDSQPVNFQSGKGERMFAGHLNRAGQFNIGSKHDYYDLYPPRPFHMEGHNAGAGTEGRLVLWDGGVSSASAWYIRKVPQEIVDKMADNAKFDELRNTVAKYSGLTAGAVVGDGIGQPHTQAIVDSVDSAIARANKLIAAETVPAPDVCEAAEAAVVKAADEFNKQVNVVPDGYYRIRARYWVYYRNENDIYFSLYNDTLPGWKHLDNTTEYLWKITNLPNGNYTIQNVKNGMYLSKAENSQNGSIVHMTAQPEVDQIIKTIKPNGKWAIWNAVDTLSFAYDPNDHWNGMHDMGRLHIWSGRSEDSGMCWLLEPVSEDEVKTLQANSEKNELYVALRDKFQEARRVYNSKTNYKLGEPIIKDVSQIYANNWSPNEGAHLEYMIDGNKDTYWNSTWEGGQEQAPGEAHYLRVYDEAGFPDSVQVNYVQRQNSSWHRSPTQMRIDVSNDATTWTTLPNAMHLADFGGSALLETVHSDSLHYVVSGIGGYKYVRFVTRCAYRGADGVYFANEKAVFGYAEYNLYPITGIDDNSETQQPLAKMLGGDALYAAIQKANAEINAGTPTQATYDELTNALNTFGQLDSNDSLLSMTRYNLAHLTAGERIGEFPDEALQAYVSTVEPLIDAFDDASGQSATAEQVMQARQAIVKAYSDLYATMVKPESGKWYTITTADPNRAGLILGAGGPSTHLYGLKYSYVLCYQTYGKSAAEMRYNWAVTDDGNGRYILQNVNAGGYFGPYTGSGDAKYDWHPILWYQPKSFSIVPLGDGQVAFQTAEGYFAMLPSGSIVLDYTNSYNNYELTNNGYAWTMEATDESHSESTEHDTNTYPGNVVAISKVYALAGLPTTTDGETIQGYDIIGKASVDDGDSIITAYKLKALPDDQVIPAGKPVVYIVPGERDASVKTQFVFTPQFNSEIRMGRDTVNGLVSNHANWNTEEAGLGYFANDSIAAAPNAMTISRDYAFIVPYLVENISDDEPDAIVYVQGAGMVNGVETTKIVGVKKFVNVYTTDGVLLRKHVDAAKATAGLKKGVYIVGSKKVVVK